MYVIRLGSYYLQGWIGWGEESCADRFDSRKASAMLARLHRVGLDDAVIVAATDVPTAEAPAQTSMF